jgi:L-asparaginase
MSSVCLVRDKKVMILYTGGTMGMKYDDNGSLAPKAGYLTEQIRGLPEIGKIGMPQFEIKEYEELIDSSCMGPSHWINIASDIERLYEQFDGFVVIMGTDTMAYAASALSFMLDNLGKPVIFTGSQIPFDFVYNDARRNLIVSMITAATTEFPEVCICFNEKVMRANRTVKVDSAGLDAFDSPNYPALASLGVVIKQKKELVLRQPHNPFKVNKNLEAKVIVLKLVPGFDDDSIHAIVKYSTTLRAIVLELYGTGNGPSKKQTLLEAIAAARAKGIVVVALTQCLRGGVSLETYTMGLEFSRAGVISGGDMTTEACTTKLAYLCGIFSDPADIENYMTMNIRGELTIRGLPQSKSFQEAIVPVPKVKSSSADLSKLG